MFWDFKNAVHRALTRNVMWASWGRVSLSDCKLQRCRIWICIKVSDLGRPWYKIGISRTPFTFPMVKLFTEKAKFSGKHAHGSEMSGYACNTVIDTSRRPPFAFDIREWTTRFVHTLSHTHFLTQTNLYKQWGTAARWYPRSRPICRLSIVVQDLWSDRTLWDDTDGHLHPSCARSVALQTSES